ncbi:MAG: recombination protein RecR [Candidatus Levybacteria bacterium RIFCSPHIGHO2_01_FULL_37_17]|nr:MAG: recombination protein RecR [Candidatus Levybacteria bacterium RIFCSPHIGHO2_01_FULL_37_17]OGH36873.1 MAG: recombination protein RecR [Candidatus Levybacteria bacterium RIFCSPLOWO2_01_FULL_38_23]
MQIPKTINKLIESFEKLPGVGPKTAQRLTFYLLHVPQGQLDIFANSLSSLKKDTVVCENCFMIDEKSPCSICSNKSRQQELVCVVEEPLDVLAFEKNGKYNGLYHVLHGKIDPLNNIGPDEIYIVPLFQRLKTQNIQEVILATNPTMEGEATAMYIAKKIGELKTQNPKLQNLKITRIGRGLPVGADIEYADEITLQRAMEGRSEF